MSSSSASAVTSPLLGQTVAGGVGEGKKKRKQEEEEEKEEKRSWWSATMNRVIEVEEAQEQILIAIPMILTNVAYYGVTLVSVMFAGHLGDLELAGATLGNSWGTVTGLALMTGLSGALETLCGQAYGAKSYRMLGLYLQSSLLISALFSVVVSIVWYFSDHILIWLHQDPEVSKLAAVYLKHFVPGLFAFGALQSILRFLQMQTVVLPLVVCSVVPLLIHVGLTYLAIHVLGLGYKGAAVSGSVTLWISLAMLVLYVKFSDKFIDTMQGFSLESFRLVVPCLKLALPSALMVCLEYWAFEILVLLAGLLPNSEISTSLIAMCVNTEAIAYNFTYGFSAAASTRVSNEIGAGNIEKAKKAVFVTLKLSVLLAVAVVLLLAFGHETWASFFSSSHAIIRAFTSMTPLLTLSIVLDSAQGVLSGVARGCGWQHLAAWTNLFAFYVIGMPLALLFSFKLAIHTKGLWMGLICGLSCQTFILLLITLCYRWTSTQSPEERDALV